jgi:CTP synthase
MPPVKYVFVTGGVVSSLGKGITTASLGRLLRARGLKVSVLKVDPYINVDAGTMNPFQHGEVFVTDDGAETDLDLGHYERFVDEPLTRRSNVTTGQVYGTVIKRERSGKGYLGQTVQVIPHITDEIKEGIRRCARYHKAQVAITEIGGTVGDIEGQPFLEAIRQMRIDEGVDNVCYVHVTLIAHLGPTDELKTKPTQHSVRELRSVGIQPDLLVCRSQRPLSEEERRKIALFCDTPRARIIENLDAESLYEVPLLLEEKGFAEEVCRSLDLACPRPDLAAWREMVHRVKEPSREAQIAMIGKYVHLHDSYLSVTEALVHGGIANDARVRISYVDSEIFEHGTQPAERLGEIDGILVPGGFGERGIEGKIRAIQYARESGTPYLGLCLGLQTAAIDYARNVAGLAGANSKEFSEATPHPVIIKLKEQEYVTRLGGTMRLGAYPCAILPGTLAERVYGAPRISERHRHRFEVNNAYREPLEAAGLVFSGTSPNGDLVEMLELPDHPFFIASQFHPEFQSRPNRPHPLFRDFIGAALDRREARREGARS